MSRRKGPAPEDRPSPKSMAADAPDSSVHAEWQRRREAAHRLIPLACGCRDLWPCKCSRAPLSQRMVDGGRAAALHLLDVGCAPMIDLDVVRALWRRGGPDRQLARDLFTLAGGDVA